MSFEEWRHKLLNDPSTPYWAVAILTIMPDLDPVDVSNTLDVLSVVANQRCQEVFEQNGVSVGEVVKRWPFARSINL